MTHPETPGPEGNSLKFDRKPPSAMVLTGWILLALLVLGIGGGMTIVPVLTFLFVYEGFAGLSRMLGRNPAYIQQFVRRGVPKRLKEAERRKLARYFAISESLLGGPADENGPGGLVPIKRIAVRASAGPGALVGGEAAKPYFGFDGRWLKALTSTPGAMTTEPSWRTPPRAAARGAGSAPTCRRTCVIRS